MGVLVRLYSLTAIIVWMVTAGCTREVTIPLNHQPVYVIEGRISNLRGPYYVRVTKSAGLLSSDDGRHPYDSAEAVTNALVIITDDMGMADTLVPCKRVNPDRYMYLYNNGTLDSIMAPFRSDFFIGERGYYETTRLKGAPGHTYHLTVRIGDSTFHASAFMPYVPTLDSAVLKEAQVVPDQVRWYLPFTYFPEPQNEKNYYLLQYNLISDYPYDNPYGRYLRFGLFPFYVVDDVILPSYVNGLAVRVMISAHNPYPDYYPIEINPKQPLQVRLSSLTREAYAYFKALGKQLEEDGNVYKPVPGSAAGNISGGALGLFWATHVSYKLILP